MAGKKISPKMAANLLKYRKSGPFNGFISKMKKRFSASLKISNHDGEYKVSFDFDSLAGQTNSGQNSGQNKEQENGQKNEISKTVDIKIPCPVCKGRIIEGKKGYGCENWRPSDGNCRFVIWKEISKKKLTLKNIETLVAGKPTIPYVLKNAQGGKFKARLKMVEKTPGQYYISILPVDESLQGRVNSVPCFR